MDRMDRRWSENGLAILISVLASIIAAPILALLGDLGRLPFWLLFLGVFIALLCVALVALRGVPSVRIAVALISQRRSTLRWLRTLEIIALIGAVIWLAATLGQRAVELTAHISAPDELQPTFDFLRTLPAGDYTLVLFILVSMALTLVLGRRNRAIAIDADECYLMLRQIESQRNERFEFEPEASLNQLRRQGRILDFLDALDRREPPQLSQRAQGVDRAPASGALAGPTRYNVTRVGMEFQVGASPFQSQDSAQPRLTSTQLQERLCDAANLICDLGGKERRWRAIGDRASPIRHGRLFGNRFDDLFNRGEGFAFYPTGGSDFVTMVIKGPPGAGKSTLALQMCVTQAQQGNVCLYFSFEDERGSLVQSAGNFGWDASADLPANKDEGRNFPLRYEGVLNLPVKQSRRRLREHTEAQDARRTSGGRADDSPPDEQNISAGAVLVSSFGRRAMNIGQRLKQVRKIWGSGPGGLRPWTHVARCVVIDSLEGFANAGLTERDRLGVTRGQMLDLKRFFRHRCDLLVILVEDDGSQTAGFAEFVADAVLALGRREEDDYTVLFAEIVKARNQTHALGKTQIKIRSRIDLEKAREAVRASVEKLNPGILVFPSLHYRLFQTQQESLFDTYTLSTGFTGFDEMLTPAAGQSGSASTSRGGLRRKTAAALLGPRDTGKSILAMNFLIEGIRENSRTLLLSLREDPSAVTDVTVPQEEGRIRFSWEKMAAPKGQAPDPSGRSGSKEMLYHRLEWDLDGVLQWREEHLSKQTDTLPYTQQLTYKRWRLPFLFQQAPVSFAELHTDPQTIAQAESVIHFLSRFGEELAAIHADSPDVKAEKDRLRERRAMKQVILWTPETRRRAAETFEREWTAFEKDLLIRTRAYEILTDEHLRRLQDPSRLNGQNENGGSQEPAEKEQAPEERASKEVAAQLIKSPLAMALNSADAEVKAFAGEVKAALELARQEFDADSEALSRQRDRVLLRDPDQHEKSKRIHLDLRSEKAPPFLYWDSRWWNPTAKPPRLESGAMDDESLMVVKGFRPGNITADDFIDQVLRIIGDPHDPQSKTASRFERVVFDDVTQLHHRFPILDKTRLFIPTLIDMFKAHGITSLFIADVDDFEVSEYNAIVSDQDHGLGIIADQLIRTKLEAQKKGSSPSGALTSAQTEERLLVEARAKPAREEQRPHEIHFGVRAGLVNVELVVPTNDANDAQPDDEEDVS
jgi:KaiC/GvpD/RAD55 family RecA-like ATPase